MLPTDSTLASPWPATTPPIRVLIADDHAVVREGLRHVLSIETGFHVVGEAANGEAVLQLAASVDPDVVVLDLSMPHGNGLETTARLQSVAPRARVLVLSVHHRVEYVLQSLRMGARGYLRKDSLPAELREAVRVVHAGGTYFCTRIASRLDDRVAMLAHGGREATKPEMLTARERDVLIGVARGATSRQIGEELGISPRTVESHRESLMRKLGIRTVAGLARFAVEMGIVPDE
jgi:DNA-binding NarL/FixJ family response regulator